MNHSGVTNLISTLQIYRVLAYSFASLTFKPHSNGIISTLIEPHTSEMSDQGESRFVQQT